MMASRRIPISLSRLFVAVSLLLPLIVVGVPGSGCQNGFFQQDIALAQESPQATSVRQTKFAGLVGGISTNEADPTVLSATWDQPTKPGSLLFAFVGLWDNWGGAGNWIYVQPQRGQWGGSASIGGADNNTVRSQEWMIPNSESRSGPETFHLWAPPGSASGKDPVLFLVEIEDDMNLTEHVAPTATLSGNTVSWTNQPSDTRDMLHLFFLVSGSGQSSPTNGYTQVATGSAASVVGGVYARSFSDVGQDTSGSVSLANASVGKQANSHWKTFGRWPNFVTGWEHGIASGGVGYGDPDASSGSSATAVTTNARSGTYSMRVNLASGGQAKWSHALVEPVETSGPGIVGGVLRPTARFYIRFDTLPANDQSIVYFMSYNGVHTIAKKIGLYYDQASGKLRPFYMKGSQSTFSNAGTAGGPVLATGQWYRVEMRRWVDDKVPLTYRLDWSVNGEEGPAYSFTLPAADFNHPREGDTHAHEIYFGNTMYYVSGTNNAPVGPLPSSAYAYRIDDVMLLGDPKFPVWPMGGSKAGVSLLTSDGLGTNVNEANFEESDGAAINANSWQRVAFGHANNWKDLQQKTSSTSSYLEFTVGNLGVTGNYFVPSVLIEPSVNKGYLLDTVVDGTASPLLDRRGGSYNDTFAGLPLIRPGTDESWSAIDINALKIRWGFDDNAATNKDVLRTLMIEVDAFESVPDYPEYDANNSSEAPSASSDGRYVAFSSRATNLLKNDSSLDSNGSSDIFLTDRVANTVDILTLDMNLEPSNGDSITPSISLDGRYVAFASRASDLVSGDTNGYQDIFVYDANLDTIALISKDGGTLANGDSSNPSISGNGQYIVFQSNASNLVSGDTNGQSDIIRADISTGSLLRISRSQTGGNPNGASANPTASSDGTKVAFDSTAMNLVADDTNGSRDVFVFDVGAEATSLVSRASGSSGELGLSDSTDPTMSSDGQIVAFASIANNLVTGDSNGVSDVFVRDRSTDVTTRITGPFGQGDGASYSPSASASGRWIAFVSSASNYWPPPPSGDQNQVDDIFEFDRDTGAISRLSVGTYESAGDIIANGESANPAISSDGSLVFYTSIAANLVLEDSNVNWDVFSHEWADTERTTCKTKRQSKPRPVPWPFPIGPGGDKSEYDQRCQDPTTSAPTPLTDAEKAMDPWTVHVTPGSFPEADAFSNIPNPLQGEALETVYLRWGTRRWGYKHIQDPSYGNHGWGPDVKQQVDAALREVNHPRAQATGSEDKWNYFYEYGGTGGVTCRRTVAVVWGIDSRSGQKKFILTTFSATVP